MQSNKTTVQTPCCFQTTQLDDLCRIDIVYSLKSTFMFTREQIKQEFSKVRTGADFPVLAMNLKNLGVTYYETHMEDGRSVYHGRNGYELITGPNYEAIIVSDQVNVERLKLDISDHQQGKSDYFRISRQSANNGIQKWAVCLETMTCTYVTKTGSKVWIEQIPDASEKKSMLTVEIPDPSRKKSLFSVEQLVAAHGKVKSGADFPAYIQEIKAMGVTGYETYVADGHTDYHGLNDHIATVPAKYDPITIADVINAEKFKSELLAHQQGKTDFPTFIKMCASVGVEKWAISMEKMTCTYYDKSANDILVEHIPA